jgi:hypothetical protein
VIAKKLLTRLIYSVVVLQILLFLFDGFPFMLSLLSVSSHIVYLRNMRRFPVVKLSDPLFVTSCGTGNSVLLFPGYATRVLTSILSSRPGQPLSLVQALLYYPTSSSTHSIRS